MVSIAIASGKGGTGKTSLAVNLGVALARYERDVVLLDADIDMANIALHLGLELAGANLHQVLAGKAELQNAVHKGPYGLKVIPAGVWEYEYEGVNIEKLEGLFRKISDLGGILLIDSPSGLGRYTLLALDMADEVLLVVNPEISSISDALKTKIVAEKLGAHVMGVVLNRVTPNDDISATEIATIMAAPILTIIPEDPEMRKSTAVGEPAILRSPNASSSIAIRKLVADLIGETPIETPRNDFVLDMPRLFARAGTMHGFV